MFDVSRLVAMRNTTVENLRCEPTGKKTQDREGDDSNREGKRIFTIGREMYIPKALRISQFPQSIIVGISQIFFNF